MRNQIKADAFQQPLTNNRYKPMDFHRWLGMLVRQHQGFNATKAIKASKAVKAMEAMKAIEASKAIRPIKAI